MPRSTKGLYTLRNRRESAMAVLRNLVATALILGLAVTSACSARSSPGIHGQPSPGGSRILSVNTKDGDAEIHVTEADGSARRKLTDNEIADVDPQWSPNGKQILFRSDRSGMFQIYMMKADGTDVRQLTREEMGVDLARMGPDGRIAYTALRARKYKNRFYDLIILDGAKTTMIARRMQVTDIAWRPDGKALACGIIGKIIFHDLARDARTVIKLGDLDGRVESYAVDTIRWRPDNRSV
ncbi:MAG: hypothetical protein OER86_02745, partial [Phycisphaerae bacterium]|nr:hypothetical protein [Phycisphaerae bacterium]